MIVVDAGAMLELLLRTPAGAQVEEVLALARVSEISWSCLVFALVVTGLRGVWRV